MISLNLLSMLKVPDHQNSSYNIRVGTHCKHILTLTPFFFEHIAMSEISFNRNNLPNSNSELVVYLLQKEE